MASDEKQTAADIVADVARNLRNAASWIKVAADDLEDGKWSDSLSKLKVGEFCAKGQAGRIAELLADEVVHAERPKRDPCNDSGAHDA